jgi:hypothetical protein
VIKWEKMVIVKGKVVWKQYEDKPQYENDRDLVFQGRRRELQEEEE